VCWATFSKQDAYANIEAYTTIIMVAPTSSTMHLLVLLSRGIDFDNKRICVRQECRVFG